MSEISTFPPAALIPLVASGGRGQAAPETRLTRDPWAPGARIRRGSPSHSVFPSQGAPRSPSSRGAFPADTDPSPRREGDAPHAPSPPRGERASCTGVAGHQVQGALAPGRVPSRAPSLRSGHPAYLRVQLGHRHGPESLGSSRTATGQGSRAAPATLTPRGR